MAPSIEIQDFDAVLVDLDGVLTTTRSNPGGWSNNTGVSRSCVMAAVTARRSAASSPSVELTKTRTR